MSKRALAVWVVEGRTVTELQIACRLKVGILAAHRRISAVLAKGGGLTWAAMRGAK